MASDVSIVVKSKGAKEAAADLRGLGAEGERSASSLAKLGPVMAGVAVGAGALAVAGGAALLKLGMSFDSAYDTIQIGTGATGKSLDGLKDSFKNVFSSVPTDMASAATAIADLNTRTGATGFELESLSKTMLEMTRITGGDLSANIESVTRAMGDWGIAGEDSATMMDELFAASQATGIGIDTLASQLVTFGAPLRQLGFSFETSAALLAKFEKEGVNAELVMGSLRIALGKLAKDGIPAEQGLRDVMQSIKDAGDASEANLLAIELFGARAGPDMAAAIREGRFEVDELVATLKNADGIILETAASTNDFGEKWQMTTNRIKVALEPAAIAVLDFANSFMDKAAPKIEEFAAWVGPKMTEISNSIAPALDSSMGVIGPKIGEAMEAAKVQFAKFQQYYESDLKPAFDNIKSAVETVVGFIKEHWDKIGPIVEANAKIALAIIDFFATTVVNLLQIVIDLIGGDWDGAWKNFSDILRAAKEAGLEILGAFVDAVGALWIIAKEAARKLGFAIKDGISDALSGLGDLLYGIGKAIMQSLWDGMKEVWDQFTGWVGGLGGQIKSLKGPIETDRKLLEPEGKAIMEGLAAGMEQGFQQEVVPVLAGAAGAIKRALMAGEDPFFDANYKHEDTIPFGKFDGSGYAFTAAEAEHLGVNAGGAAGWTAYNANNQVMFGNDPNGWSPGDYLLNNELKKMAGGGGGGGGGNIRQLIINTIDARSFRDWLNAGGGEEIAAYFNGRKVFA